MFGSITVSWKTEKLAGEARGICGMHQWDWCTVTRVGVAPKKVHVMGRHVTQARGVVVARMCTMLPRRTT